MLNITITEQTPHNMLRAIRAACNELLGDMPAERQILNEVVINLKNDEKASQHVTEAFNQTSGPSIEDLQASGQLMNARVDPQDEAHLDLKPETDSAGAEWNPELHASTKAKNQDGTWKKRRGAGKETGTDVEKVMDVMAEAVTGAAAAPSLPPLPPAPPATPRVTMNDVYALITNNKCVLNDVIAAAQAMGFADVGAFSRDATPEQRVQLLAQLTKEVA